MQTLEKVCNQFFGQESTLLEQCLTIVVRLARCVVEARVVVVVPFATWNHLCRDHRAHQAPGLFRCAKALSVAFASVPKLRNS